MINKKTFSITVNDEELKLAVIRPSNDLLDKALMFKGKKFREAVDAGMPVKIKIDKLMREQNIWDDVKQEEYSNLIKNLHDSEMKLAKGGVKLNEAKFIALGMRAIRYKLRELLHEKTELESNTAEAYAENAHFNYLVSQCTVYEDTGKHYFKSYDYYKQVPNDDKAAINAAKLLAEMIYNMDDNYEASLPENKFLKKYHFCNDELRLIDKDGNYVDAFGNKVDINGRKINEKGELIDGDGNILSENGEYIIEQLPFLDDEGNPVN